jgi:hypothetical protein
VSLIGPVFYTCIFHVVPSVLVVAAEKKTGPVVTYGQIEQLIAQSVHGHKCDYLIALMYYKRSTFMNKDQLYVLICWMKSIKKINKKNSYHGSKAKIDIGFAERLRKESILYKARFFRKRIVITKKNSHMCENSIRIHQAFKNRNNQFG